jgi:hypothetical protein
VKCGDEEEQIEMLFVPIEDPHLSAVGVTTFTGSYTTEYTAHVASTAP